MMQYWMIVMLFLGIVRAENNEKDHNGAEHRALCDVLRAAVVKWKEIKHLDGPLKAALKKIIFGSSGAKDNPSELSMPDDYNLEENVQNIKPNTRKNWCGVCENNGQKHYPGESAPHDLVCLCTPGQLGYPLNGDNNVKTLCGKNLTSWVPPGSVGEKGWYTELFKDVGKVNNKIKSTWNTIVEYCLRIGDGKNLEEAVKTFREKLGKIEDDYYLGNHSNTPDCSGAPGDGVCVKYCNKYARYKPWWTQLEDIINKDKEEREKEDAERKKTESFEKGNKLKASNRPQTAPEKSAQNPLPTSRVSQLPQTEESDYPPRAEQVISNINARIEEDSSTIILPFWLLLVFLYN